MNTWKKRTLLAWFFCLFSVSVFANSPVTTLERAANNILSALQKNKANLKSNPRLVYRLVNSHLIPHVDVYGMSRSVLGRKVWNSASKSEKKRFTRAFTQLVVRTYSGALRDYSGEKIRFSPLRGGYQGKRFVKVNSMIMRPSGQNIPLKYKMVSKGGRWKVYDMSVEGVSLLQSFKSQFRSELRKGNMTTLISRLEGRSRRRG